MEGIEFWPINYCRLMSHEHFLGVFKRVDDYSTSVSKSNLEDRMSISVPNLKTAILAMDFTYCFHQFSQLVAWSSPFNSVSLYSRLFIGEKEGEERHMSPLPPKTCLSPSRLPGNLGLQYRKTLHTSFRRCPTIGSAPGISGIPFMYGISVAVVICGHVNNMRYKKSITQHFHDHSPCTELKGQPPNTRIQHM